MIVLIQNATEKMCVKDPYICQIAVFNMLKRTITEIYLKHPFSFFANNGFHHFSRVSFD